MQSAQNLIIALLYILERLTLRNECSLSMRTPFRAEAGWETEVFIQNTIL